MVLKMGKDFIYVKLNNFDLRKVYNKLFSNCYEIIETSQEKYFNRIPNFNEIIEIELGTDNTKETIIRLDNNNFVVVNKTIDIKELN